MQSMFAPSGPKIPNPALGFGQMPPQQPPEMQPQMQLQTMGQNPAQFDWTKQGGMGGQDGGWAPHSGGALGGWGQQMGAPQMGQFGVNGWHRPQFGYR